MKKRDFISIADLKPEEAEQWITIAQDFKNRRNSPHMNGKTLALLFEKPSLRTKVSFDVAMYQLGGHAIYLSPAEVGLGSRESVPDVARVLSRFVNGIVARTYKHETVLLLAQFATIPVINGLSEMEHPCQALGDFLTIKEKFGEIKDLTLSFIGDGNNVANSLLLLCSMLGVNFLIACPAGYEPNPNIIQQASAFARKSGASIRIINDPSEAVKNADVIYTDVWTSMGQESETEKRKKDFKGFQITNKLLSLAHQDSIFMHPLPAHTDEEIENGLLGHKKSVVFDQAENRLHSQKAVLYNLLGRTAN